MSEELLCTTCQLEPPYECFDDCKKCAAAYVAAKPQAWQSNRKWYVGTPWIAEFEAEVARQADALRSMREVA